MGVLNSNMSASIIAGSGILLTFTATEGQYLQLTIAASGGGGGASAVQEEGVTVLASAAILNFDGDDFDITDEGSDTAGINVAATHAGSTHSAATDTHIADTSAAHAASAVSVDSTTLAGVGTNVQSVFEENDNQLAALETVDYLVGTITGTLSSEIVVGTSPGGELGGTWASPTVDATHSGSTHAAATTTHEAAADPHTGYVLESLFDAAGDLITASADNTPAKLTRGADDTFLRATGSTIAYEAIPFSIGALLEGAPPSNGTRINLRAPFACTVTNVRGHIDTGTNAVINARLNQTSDFLSGDLTVDPADQWESGTADQNQAVAAGDDIEVELVSTSGAVTQVNIQVDLTRP